MLQFEQVRASGAAHSSQVADPNGCVHTVTTQNGATVLAVVWGRTESV